ncbi:E3 ubiquitin-protein ligase ubr1 [Neophaeococcomyces mojaviensis]|uniref:E3 ubiquitin-protein ligase ubr1 n=1 Tax=Neophaeococcomyces mojaviensis TaxID=3383035 RepID=A0ACC3ABW1_9EURO|nr:E3 ubiquitin-protein ligase ubr1 [Knufia sp. JES_112]
MTTHDLDSRLCQALCEHPRQFDNKYTDDARDKLLETLFRSLTNDRPDYLSELFPHGFPKSYSLQEAQGAFEETEYTEAARGHPCGHILKPGEARYRCSTCTNDPTVVLCSRCFTASNHEGHQFEISVSNGNTGCCDCGDEEAWKIPVKCAIHSSLEQAAGFVTVEPVIPEDLSQAVHTTVGRALDYFCDVMSCSPENLRTAKTMESVQQDEAHSRLDKGTYVTGDDIESNPEYNLVMWNDEKHTMDEVQDQCARACRERRKFGLIKAEEANDYGRSIVSHSRDLKEMLRRAKIIEEIKVTVTVRSARDTFREQMCGTILEWLSDIAGCVLKDNTSFLRQVICEEMLQVWRVGSQAWNVRIGREGTEDHGLHDVFITRFPDTIQILLQRNQQQGNADEDDDMDEDANGAELTDADEEDEEEDDDYEQVESQMAESIMESNENAAARILADIISDVDEMDTDGDNDFLDANERMDAEDAIPPPPPPPTAPQTLDTEPAIALATDDLSRHNSASLGQGVNANFRNVPRTPGNLGAPAARQNQAESTHWRASSHPKGKSAEGQLPDWEDIRKNIRLDSMILFDLRLWKKLRVNLRDLLISTVIKVPQFKRILGLRFAGLYTPLAQLYLVADREPDHSILHLSVQILTTPSIAEEVIQKGNFLTNLMAILYTFLTTRQVGYPEEVDPDATLGFDAGSVANRRLYQFFHDLGYFLATPLIQARVRLEKQYLLQYLDLAKLSQGICPNVRAVGDHVEYETDAWISASLLTREINKLCRQVTDAFKGTSSVQGIDEYLSGAIRQACIATLLVCSGLDSQRFEQSEIKELIKFHDTGPFPGSSRSYKTVDFVVEKGTLSFHHPLHYTLSWLLENGKDTYQTIQVIQDTADELVSRFNASSQSNRRFPLHTLYETGEDALLGLFDYPLRVCAWLAQMRANMWVRNGMSLRHQMNQYKSVTYRDVGHHRDLFLLQTALVACSPERVLASMIDRFGLFLWVSGTFVSHSDADQAQLVDIAEDFVYLLINMLSDRDSLSSVVDDAESQLSILRKDIAHTLCFKPLSYSDLTNRLTERSQDHEQLQSILVSMTNFKAPEGLHDSGTFELKPEYLQELDPYNSHFTKNQRDEAESIYKTWMARKLNKQADDIVLEPKLNTIKCQAYQGLCAVIHTPLFTTMLGSMLVHMVNRPLPAPVSPSRAESFLQVVLHLSLIATMEDHSVEEDVTRNQSLFIKNALTQRIGEESLTIVAALHKIWLAEEFASCRSKVKHILRIFNRQWPAVFTEATKDLDFPAARFDSASPANLDVDIEAKKKQAMERKARIMAQMQQQQQSFMTNQGMTDWGDDDMSDTESELPESTETRLWKFPAGVCIQCREEMDNTKFFGIFAMFSDAHLLRETPKDDPSFVEEVLVCPENLDESNEESRPFGVSGANTQNIKRYASDGTESTFIRRGLSKGWPKGSTVREPLSTSCGHLMHYSCFENYYDSVRKRHALQISRRQPERVSQNEFVCPLCKALANTFLPVLYRHSEQSYPGSLLCESSYEMFLEETLPAARKSFEVLEKEGTLSTHLSHTEKQLYADTVLTFTTNAMTPLVHSMAEVGGLPDLAQSPAVDALVELSKIYARLRSTLEIAGGSAPKTTSSTRQVVTAMFKVLTNSITAVEVAHRGRSSVGTCLIDGISAQTLTHLQVMSHSIHAYSAAMVMIDQSEGLDLPYQNFVQEMSARLFGKDLSDREVGSLLSVDGFASFLQYSIVYARMQGVPVIHLLRLCLTQELIRVAIWWLRIRGIADGGGTLVAGDASAPRSAGLSREEYRALAGFVFWLTSSMHDTTNQPLLPVNEVGPLFRAMQTYALAFMRKAVLLLHVAHGVDFPAAPTLAGKPELDRLLGLCKLPDLATILSSFSEFTVETALPNLAQGWISAWAKQDESQRSASIKLLHPTPFELIGLPQYYDVLIEECQKRKCPTTGKELTDPALCLFCGDIFCSQAWCCMKDKVRGGCNHHIEECSAPIGIYLFIRKCNIVLLDVRKDPRKLEKLQEGQEGSSLADVISAHGSFFPAPYLTKHGETDQGLRTKHQLILNQKRYDKLVRDVWLMLNGSVWSAIARKLEGDVNAGGWETL